MSRFTLPATAWTPVTFGVLLALALGWMIESLTSEDDSAAPPPAPAAESWIEHEVRMVSGNVELAGSLTLPPGPGPFPAVMAISGAGAQDREGLASDPEDARAQPTAFARAGIALLRTDDRGVGASTGDSRQATFDDLVSDARAAFAFLAGRPEIDGRRIGLLGASQGASIAALTAAGHDEVAFVVLYSGPGLPGRELLLDQIARLDRASGLSPETVGRIVELTRQALEWLAADDDPAWRRELRPIVRELRRLRRQSPFSSGNSELSIEREIDFLTSPAYRAGLGYDPRPALSRLRCPVLAIYGELDLQVHSDVNLPPVEEALAAAPTGDVTAVRLPGLNHLLQPAVTGLPDEYAGGRRSPEVHRLTVAWITERFGTLEEMP